MKKFLLLFFVVTFLTISLLSGCQQAKSAKKEVNLKSKILVYSNGLSLVDVKNLQKGKLEKKVILGSTKNLFPRNVDVSDDGKYLYYALSDSKELYQVELKSMKKEKIGQLKKVDVIASLSISPKKDKIALIVGRKGSNGAITMHPAVFDILSKKLKVFSQLASIEAQGFNWLNDSTLLFVLEGGSTGGRAIYALNTSTGKCELFKAGGYNYILASSFILSPDRNEILVFFDEEKSLRLIDLEGVFSPISAYWVDKYYKDIGKPVFYSWSKDGKKAAVIFADNSDKPKTVMVIDFPSEKKSIVEASKDEFVSSAVLSSDGSRLLMVVSNENGSNYSLKMVDPIFPENAQYSYYQFMQPKPVFVSGVSIYQGSALLPLFWF